LSGNFTFFVFLSLTLLLENPDKYWYPGEFVLIGMILAVFVLVTWLSRVYFTPNATGTLKNT